MLTGLSLGHIINYFREKWQTLPDMRNQDNNNLTYPIVDVALSAFSVFFMQSPSFLAHQRDMQRRKGKSNADTLFKIERIPVAQEIRNLLDPIAPKNFHGAYYAILSQLRRSGYMKESLLWYEAAHRALPQRIDLRMCRKLLKSGCFF